MKTLFSALMITALLAPQFAQAAPISYNCSNSYGAIYTATLKKNRTENSSEDFSNTAGIVTGSVLGVGHYGSMIVVIGAPAVAIGTIGLITAGFVGYQAGKGVSQLVRHLKGNPYHKANQVLALSLIPDEKIKPDQNKLIKLTSQIQNAGVETSYEEVKNTLAALSQSDVFCPEGVAVKYSELRDILVEELSL